MRTKPLKNIFAGTLVIIGAAFSNYGYASALIIDDFTEFQEVLDTKDSVATTSTENIHTGTDLVNASRTFTAMATPTISGSFEDIASGNNLLEISNSAGSSGTASILWNFDTINFTSSSNAILLEVVKINHDFNVEMIANGTSRFGVKNFNATGNYLINFSDFSNSSVFTSISSLNLNFTGPLAWAGQFKLSTAMQPVAAPITAVPLPPALALMGSALLGLMGISRSKKQS
jgi:hypothetical protein